MFLFSPTILQQNLFNFSTNCTGFYPIRPLFGFLLIHQTYFPLFCLLGLNGICQNLLYIQTLLSVSCREKWSVVYRLMYSSLGLVLSICLMINTFWNSNYFRLLTFVCLILNSSAIWISATLAFERMLMQFFFYKLYGKTSKHVLIISLCILFLVLISYLLSIRYPSIALIFFFFHLITPTCIHLLSFILTFISIIQRKCYLSEQSINCTRFFQILASHSGFYVAPTCTMICLVAAILSLHYCFLLVFNTVFFFPQMISFVIYVLPSKTTMKNFRNQSPVGQLLVKLHL